MPVPDFSPGEVLTAAAMDSIGLWKITEVAFSAQSQVDFLNVFSSSYVSYKIVFHDYTQSSANEMNIRLRDSGGVISSSNYDMSRLESTGTAPSDTKNAFTFTAASGWTLSYVPSAAGAGINSTMEIYRPNEVAYTRFTAHTARFDNATGGLYNVTAVGGFRLTTQMTGFSLLAPGGATISGKVSVYGQR
jgi:hypothetical protein